MGGRKPTPTGLPRGVTGFFDVRSRPPTVDPAAFAAACRVAAGALGGHVEGVGTCPLARSYLVARLVMERRGVDALCNAVHPLVAFVPAGLGEPHTRDVLAMPDLAAAFRDWTDFVPLDPDWLRAEIHPADLDSLAAVERRQIRHWAGLSPVRSRGDVVFNGWD